MYCARLWKTKWKVNAIRSLIKIKRVIVCVVQCDYPSASDRSVRKNDIKERNEEVFEKNSQIEPQSDELHWRERKCAAAGKSREGMQTGSRCAEHWIINRSLQNSWYMRRVSGVSRDNADFCQTSKLLRNRVTNISESDRCNIIKKLSFFVKNIKNNSSK